MNPTLLNKFLTKNTFSQQTYSGEGKTKKLAKLAAAEQALKSFIQFADASSAHRAMGKDKSLESLTDFTSDDHFGNPDADKSGAGSAVSGSNVQDAANMFTPFENEAASSNSSPENGDAVDAGAASDGAAAERERNSKSLASINKKLSRKEMKKMKQSHKRSLLFSGNQSYAPAMGLSSLIPPVVVAPRFFSPTDMSFLSPAPGSVAAYPGAYPGGTAGLKSDRADFSADPSFTSFSSSPSGVSPESNDRDFSNDLDSSSGSSPSEKRATEKPDSFPPSKQSSESRSSPVSRDKIGSSDNSTAAQTPAHRKKLKAKRKNKNNVNNALNKKTKHNKHKQNCHAPSFLSSSSANNDNAGDKENGAASALDSSNASAAAAPDDSSSSSTPGKNPVMILNELKPGLKYEFVSEVGESHAKVCILEWNNDSIVTLIETATTGEKKNERNREKE